MRKCCVIFYLVFNLTTTLYSQVKDFQISQDKAPATFIHQDPKLYSNRYNGYTVVWKDFREGEPSFYAQVYDSLNRPLGKNFKINGNEQLYFSHKNCVSLKTMSFAYSYWNPLSNYFQILGSVYNNGNEIIKDLNLAWGMYPDCGLGYLGVQTEMITTDSNFVFFFMNDGNVTVMRYDYSGKSLTTLNPTDGSGLPTAAGAISADINNNSNYLLVWFNARKVDLPIGYYGTVFNSNDSAIVTTKLLLPYSIDSTKEIYYVEGRLPYIKVKTVSDSLFEVFFIRSDSLKCLYAKFDERGNLIGNINYFNIPYYKSNNVNAYYSLNTPFFTPIDENSWGIVLSVDTYSGTSDKKVNSIFYFDKDGNKAGNDLIDTTLSYSFSNGISLQGMDDFIIPVQENSDIYLKHYINFVAADSLKVNDDLSGNNQLNSFVEKVNDTKYLSAWQDETGLKGRFIDANGNNESEIFDLPGYSVKYFNDGSSIALWKKRMPDSFYKLGFYILDQNQNIVCEDSLLSSDDSYVLNAESKIISDSLFLVCFGNYGGTKIASFNKKADKLNEYVLSGNYPYSTQIYLENRDSVWVSWNGKLQLFSSELKPVSQVLNISPAIFLGNNNFLLQTIGNNNYTSCSYNGYIINSSMDTLKNIIPLSYNAEEISVKNLTDSKFIVLYKVNNKIYEKAFSNNGDILSDSLQISSEISSYKKLPCVAATNTKVLFTWSDARNEGNGYDIYGNIWDISRITSVRRQNNTAPSSFYLSQNFPNPFNPSTKIRFSVPSTANGSVNVQIKVYDILGKEVATLLNEKKSAGIYELEFNTQSGSGVKNLASGIYFYQMKAESFIATRKFILLK